MKFQLFGGAFWGILLIIGGILFILRNYVNINIPIFRILFGFLLIYWGLSVIFGGFVHRDSSTIVFSNATNMEINDTENEYNIIFGSGNIDLSDFNKLKEKESVEINAIFGSANVLIPDNIPIHINSNAVFGETKIPEKKTSFIGEINSTLNDKQGIKPVNIEVNAIFGSITVETVHIEIPRPETADVDAEENNVNPDN